MSDGIRIGTYVAEEVASRSFEILAAVQADSKNRLPAAQNALSSSPGSQGGKMKRRMKDRGSFKATTLPALVSIDPLLQGHEGGISDAQKQRLANEEAQRKTRAEQIRASSARLTQGKGRSPRFESRLPLTDRPSTREADSQMMAALTQPLPWFDSRGQDSVANTANSSATSSMARLPGAGSDKVKSKQKSRDYFELFGASLRGTDFARPANARQPGGSRRSASRSPRKFIDDLTIMEQSLVPEDAVEAYFQAEQVRVEQRKKREAEEEKARNKSLLDEKQNQLSGGGQKSFNAKARLQKVVMSNAMQVTIESNRQDRQEGAKGDKSPRPQKKLQSVYDVALAAQLDLARKKREKMMQEVLEQIHPKQKLNATRKETCQMARLWVLGQVGNENIKLKKEKEAVFYEACGTKEDMLELVKAWEKLDVDGAGKIDAAALKSFGHRMTIDVVAANAWSTTLGVSGKTLESIYGPSRLPGWLASTPVEERNKFVQKLCERIGTTLLSPRRTAFILEDLIRLVWSCCSNDEVRQMKEWCEEIWLTRDKYRVSPPPVLPDEEKVALQAVFKHFDKDGSGTVSAPELIAAGLMDRDSANRFIREVDTDGSGEIDIEEFCEMMCPHGFRANGNSEMGSTPGGDRVRYDKKAECWRIKDAPPVRS